VRVFKSFFQGVQNKSSSYCHITTSPLAVMLSWHLEELFWGK